MDNLSYYLADAFEGTGGFFGGVIAVILFFAIIGILKAFIKVAFSDKLLVVTGRRKKAGGRKFGFSVERGRTTSIPYFQAVYTLDLGVLPINVRVEGVNSANGITVGADATACVCIDDDDEAMVYSAVEKLMGKSRAQIHSQIQQTLVGNFRGALNKATPLQAIGMEDSWREESSEDDESSGSSSGEKSVGERAQFRAELLSDINSDLSSFGMKVVSVSLQKIWDTSNYIANLAQKTLAQKRQEVEIEEARLHAKAEQSESDSDRRVKVAKAVADEAIIAAREKLEVYRKESNSAIERASLEADNIISQEQNMSQRAIQEQMNELQKLKNESQVTLLAGAQEKAARILSEGEQKSIEIIESTRNDILSQKVDLLSKTKEGKAVLFIQQKLPELFKSFKDNAKGLRVDSLVIMDDDKGFNGAVNRGPAAFVDFLKEFENALGVDVKDILTSRNSDSREVK